MLKWLFSKSSNDFPHITRFTSEWIPSHSDTEGIEIPKYFIVIKKIIIINVRICQHYILLYADFICNITANIYNAISKVGSFYLEWNCWLILIIVGSSDVFIMLPIIFLFSIIEVLGVNTDPENTPLTFRQDYFLILCRKSKRRERYVR